MVYSDHKPAFSRLSQVFAPGIQRIFWHLLFKQLCLAAITDKQKPALVFFKELKRRKAFKVGIAYIIFNRIGQ
jgi:hypothetical protein